MKKHSLITALMLISAITAVSAQDWPQYLGPDRNSVSSQKRILRNWPENGPDILWSVKVGIGFGGPVIKDGKAYLLDRDDKVGDKLRCFDMNSGKEIWSFSYDEIGRASCRERV